MLKNWLYKVVRADYPFYVPEIPFEAQLDAIRRDYLSFDVRTNLEMVFMKVYMHFINTYSRDQLTAMVRDKNYPTIPMIYKTMVRHTNRQLNRLPDYHEDPHQSAVLLAIAVIQKKFNCWRLKHLLRKFKKSYDGHILGLCSTYSGNCVKAHLEGYPITASYCGLSILTALERDYSPKKEG